MPNSLITSTPGFSERELAAIRGDFPTLSQPARGGKPLVYLDTAATSHKPECVIDAEQDFYLHRNSAVHRGAHFLAEQATEIYENARITTAALVNAHPDEVVWTKNATESLNLIAYAFMNVSADGGDERFHLQAGDEIVITEAEHHANIVPWQQVAARTGATLRWLTLTDDGRIDLESLDVINEKTKVVSFAHAANVTGAIAPVAQIVAAAQAVDALVIIDACQSVPHLPVDFATLGADFIAFSAHKMYGPTGLGVLVGKHELLSAMPPFMTGGSMVEIVTMESTTFMAPPQRFEAGTQMVAQTAGMNAAAAYLAELGLENVAAQEHVLTQYLLDGVASVPGVRILGPTSPEDRLGVVAFEVAGVHPHDVGQVLDDAGIAVRVGHHCAQPVHKRLGVHASSRASTGIYSTPADVDIFIEHLNRVQTFFGV